MLSLIWLSAVTNSEHSWASDTQHETHLTSGGIYQIHGCPNPPHTLNLTLTPRLTHAVEIIMSFGVGIGDFIAVGDLCWKLYSQVYKVSRDAPEELRGLSQELGNFHNTIQLLIEELKDKDSVLSNSGDVRRDTVRRVM